MFKKTKKKIQKALIPLSIIAINTSVAFANDEITRKMDNAKKWTIGILTTAAAINVGYAIFKAGNVTGQSEIESAQKYRRNSIIGFIGVISVDIFIGLWNSW